MDQYILDLLITQDRVIIPEFGAFMKMKDKEGHIVFNEFLSFNDGVLLKHIADKEKIEADEALKKVEEYVNKIQQELDKNGKYKLKELGELIKDDKGKIQLVQGEGTKIKAGPEPAEKKEEPAPKPEKPVSKRAIPPKKAVEEKKKEDEPKPIEEPVQKEEEEKPEETVKEKEVIEIDDTKEPGQKFEPEIKKAESEVPGSIKIDKEKIKVEKSYEKKKPGYLLWLLLVLIVLFIVWFVFLRKGKSDTEQLFPQEIIPVEEVVEEPIEEESSPVIEEAEPVPDPEVIQVLPADRVKAYYVVAGCFELEDNADDYMEELRNKGYEARKFGTIGRLHMVSVGSFPSRQEALKLLRDVRFEVEPDAWIIHY